MYMEKRMKRFTDVLIVTLTLMGLLLWFVLPSLGQNPGRFNNASGVKLFLPLS